jgi:ATP-dependent Clp protease ATP-binding subunit ClpA
MSSPTHSWFERSSEQPLAPAMLAGLIVTLSGAVIALNQVSAWFSPVLLLLAIGGLVYVAIRQMGAGVPTPSRAREENFSRLGSIDFAQTEQWLKTNVRGQDEAIEIVSSSLRSQVAIAQPGQLLGSFLLVGPTGTGKTFLPQLLAQALYPDSDPVILRMNQYKTPNDVQTLLGPPPGMPGYEVGGSLTRPVLINPKRVVILDELEKAHPDLHHCLFDILDAGTCREKSSGKEVDFSQCVFFGTSNAGVEALRKLRQEINPTKDQALWLGQSRDALVDNAGFDRAFLARWAHIILMDELSAYHVAEVACLQLARYWRDYGIELTYTSPEILLDTVAKNVEFKQYGVRQLENYLKQTTNSAIVQARTSGFSKVRLEAGPNNELLIQPVLEEELGASGASMQ